MLEKGGWWGVVRGGEGWGGWVGLVGGFGGVWLVGVGRGRRGGVEERRGEEVGWRWLDCRGNGDREGEWGDGGKGGLGIGGKGIGGKGEREKGRKAKGRYARGKRLCH